MVYGALFSPRHEPTCRCRKGCTTATKETTSPVLQGLGPVGVAVPASIRYEARKRNGMILRKRTFAKQKGNKIVICSRKHVFSVSVTFMKIRCACNTNQKNVMDQPDLNVIKQNWNSLDPILFGSRRGRVVMIWVYPKYYVGDGGNIIKFNY